MPAKGDSRPAAERFAAKVNVDGPVPAHCPELGPCHLWTGATHHRDGYGHFWSGRVSAKGRPLMDRAHRWAWEQDVGPIPEGMLVMHACDTPLCVRLSHLQLGTVADNSADMVAKGRHLRGARGPGAKLTPAEVGEIRRLGGSISQAKIAARFGVSQKAVSNVLRGASW